VSKGPIAGVLPGGFGVKSPAGIERPFVISTCCGGRSADPDVVSLVCRWSARIFRRRRLRSVRAASLISRTFNSCLCASMMA
jgi:hypothetical protein